MLVLSRKVNEEIVIGNGIRVKVIGVSGNQIRLGIIAPREVPVHREEVYRMLAEFQTEDRSTLPGLWKAGAEHNSVTVGTL